LTLQVQRTRPLSLGVKWLVGLLSVFCALFFALWRLSDRRYSQEHQLREQGCAALKELVRNPPKDKFNQFGLNGKELLMKMREISLQMSR